MTVSNPSRPFWETLRPHEMTQAQWESLCDGCGKCCLNKLEDWDTGEIAFTNVACTLFDDETCRCSDYDDRFATVPDCIKLTPDTIRNYLWLPDTCAYRLVEEGMPLAAWHPLVSGSELSVHAAGISVQHSTVSEDDVAADDYEFHLVDWIEGGEFTRS
ncbi:MAG: YcgN family cysteine cluster protein [Pseudomonadota bacterium]